MQHESRIIQAGSIVTRSINKAIMLATRGGAVVVKEASSFDEEIGQGEPVLLPDGSVVYSAETLTNARTPLPLTWHGYLTGVPTTI